VSQAPTAKVIVKKSNPKSITDALNELAPTTKVAIGIACFLFLLFIAYLVYLRIRYRRANLQASDLTPFEKWVAHFESKAAGETVTPIQEHIKEEIDRFGVPVMRDSVAAELPASAKTNEPIGEKGKSKHTSWLQSVRGIFRTDGGGAAGGATGGDETNNQASANMSFSAHDIDDLYANPESKAKQAGGGKQDNSNNLEGGGGGDGGAPQPPSRPAAAVRSKSIFGSYNPLLFGESTKKAPVGDAIPKPTPPSVEMTAPPVASTFMQFNTSTKAAAGGGGSNPLMGRSGGVPTASSAARLAVPAFVAPTARAAAQAPTPTTQAATARPPSPPPDNHEEEEDKQVEVVEEESSQVQHTGNEEEV